MDPRVAETILEDRRIGYAVADGDLNIVMAGGVLDIFGAGEVLLGDSLLDLIPELVGSEDVLTAVMARDLPRFQLELINRSTPEGDSRYLMVTVLLCRKSCGQQALLIVAADTSQQGRYTQKLTQQRNDLRLLKRNLDEANQQLDFLLRHYVPPEVASALMEQRVLPQLGGHLREVSVLFADVRGSTRLAEQLPPAQMVELLNGYLNVAGDAIAEMDGTLDQFLGDAVMVLFNAPDDQPDHARRAVQTGLMLQEKVAAYGRQLSSELPPFHFGVGVNTGPALVGNIGAHWRYHYTAIGDSVNVASRVCSAAQAGEVLIGPATYDRLRECVEAAPLAPLQFKGKSLPLAVYRVTALRGADCRLLT